MISIVFFQLELAFPPPLTLFTLLLLLLSPPGVRSQDALLPASVSSVSSALRLHLASAVDGQLASKAAHVAFMASLNANLLVPLDSSPRAPIDLVAVLDRSFSMYGEKLAMAKLALSFVLDNLGEQDTFSLVTYETAVKIDLGLTVMDEAGRSLAKKAVLSVTPDSMTNLSGGLLQGLDVLRDRKNPANISAVFLFTDGQSNAGIVCPTQLVKAVQSNFALHPKQHPSIPSSSLPLPTIYSFGFGADHDEALLHRIAEIGQGMYYHIPNEAAIPVAFADSLAGLHSTVAQDVSIIIEVLNGAVFQGMLSDNYLATKISEGDGVNTAHRVVVKDISAEEARNLLFNISIPVSTATPGEDYLKVTVTYMDILTQRQVTLNATSSLARLDLEAEEGGIRVNLDVDQQLNRLLVAKAIKEAQQLAKANHLSEGRARLILAKAVLVASVSAKEPLTSRLGQELDQSLVDLSTPTQYLQAGGDKEFVRRWSGHYAQRSNHVGQQGFDYYSTSRRSLFKRRAWHF